MPSFSPVLYLPKTYAICKNYDQVSLVVANSTTSDSIECVQLCMQRCFILQQLLYTVKMKLIALD